MNAQPDPADVAAMREEGDLLPYLISLTGRTPKPKPAPPTAPPDPSYHIPHPGAWPCGTAASGPTPLPCPACRPAPATPTRDTAA